MTISTKISSKRSRSEFMSRTDLNENIPNIREECSTRLKLFDIVGVRKSAAGGDYAA